MPEETTAHVIASLREHRPDSNPSYPTPARTRTDAAPAHVHSLFTTPGVP